MYSLYRYWFYHCILFVACSEIKDDTKVTKKINSPHIALYEAIKMNYNKEIKHLVDDLILTGWRVREGRHLVCYAPNGRGIVTIGRSVSDWRAIENIKRDIKKALRSSSE